MKKPLTIIATLIIGLTIGWFLKGLYTSSETIHYQDKLQSQVDKQIEDSATSQQNMPLIQVLVDNSPDYVFFEEDYEYNQQSFDYLGKIGRFKVVKYEAEFGPGSKGNYKVIFYNADNSFYGYYQMFMGLEQVCTTGNDSLQIYHVGIDLKNDLPDSLCFGPDLWIEFNKN